MEEPRRIIVVGAGASGMTAALSAAVSGAHVCLLEKLAKPGRSVMASGNGRCNFANANLAPERYNDPAFVGTVMGSEPLRPILGMFESLGLWWVSDDEGRLYPRSRAAASVLDVLLAGLRAHGVMLELECVASDISVDEGGRYAVELEDGRRMGADALVWAAGGGSAEVPARCLRLARTKERPALCPLACEPRPPKALDGVRANCAVELRSSGSLIVRQEGEVLFRPYGVSGIVVFDVSRLARPGDSLVLDFMPDVDAGELERVLAERADRRRDDLATAAGRAAFLDGALHPKLARALMERVCGRDGARAFDVADLARAVKGWGFTVAGPADAGQAQITQGGLDTAGFEAVGLAARDCPGFYACGEALDVDGECGGLNLAWAWSSGMVAGVAAARHVLRAKTC